MKKNFMAIASLLIAAMLLVVSCAPEANVEGKVEDGLVNASLMATAAGKALTVTHEGDPLTYSVTLTAGWADDPNYKMDKVVGAGTINNVDIKKDIPLGWISQGLWTITVEGKRNGDTVIQGSTTKYITKGDADVVVFLGTDISSKESTYLDFDITVNELAANNAGYSLKASIVSADGRSPSFTKDCTTFDVEDKGSTRTYKITNSDTKSVVSLTPGYYKVTVQLIKTTPAATEGGQAKEDVIGGITRGVLVTGESKITIKGSVSASDFAKGNLTVIKPEVTISGITAKKDVTEKNTEGTAINLIKNSDDLYEGIVELPTSYKDESYTITYTVSASCDQTNQSGVTIKGPTYTWTVDGKPQTGSDASFKATYNAPGPKNVTCLVTYVCSVSINGTEYDFTFGNEAVASVLVKGPAVAVEPTGEATTQTP